MVARSPSCRRPDGAVDPGDYLPDNRRGYSRMAKNVWDGQMESAQFGIAGRGIFAAAARSTAAGWNLGSDTASSCAYFVLSGKNADGTANRNLPGAVKITGTETGVFFSVKLKTRAGRSRLTGIDGGVLKAEVAAPPLGGLANEALLVLLSRQLDAPLTRFRIARGRTSARKLIQLDNISVGELRRKLIERSLIQVAEKR